MLRTLRAASRVFLLAACTCASTGTSGAPHCAEPAERDALNARALQTDLMVAALACDRRPDYNAFVLEHRGALAAHGRTMRAYFKRHYGRDGERLMNRFVTRLANDASSASNTDRALYCRVTSALFAGLAGASAPAFDLLLRDPLLAARHGVAACGAAASPRALSARP